MYLRLHALDVIYMMKVTSVSSNPRVYDTMLNYVKSLNIYAHANDLYLKTQAQLLPMLLCYPFMLIRAFD